MHSKRMLNLKKNWSHHNFCIDNIGIRRLMQTSGNHVTQVRFVHWPEQQLACPLKRFILHALACDASDAKLDLIQIDLDSENLKITRGRLHQLVYTEIWDELWSDVFESLTPTIFNTLLLIIRHWRLHACDELASLPTRSVIRYQFLVHFIGVQRRTKRSRWRCR